MNEIPRDAREVYRNERGEPVAYCPKDGLGVTDLLRGEFWHVQDHARMRQLAVRAKEKTAQTGKQHLVVCIDVDDPTWTDLVDMLMPGHDWNVYRNRGERPVARGVVPAAPMAEVVASAYPAAGDVPLDRTCTLVFAAGGVSVQLPPFKDA